MLAPGYSALLIAPVSLNKALAVREITQEDAARLSVLRRNVWAAGYEYVSAIFMWEKDICILVGCLVTGHNRLDAVQHR